MESEVQRHRAKSGNMLEWQPFLAYFLGDNPEPGTTISIVPTLPTSTKEWDRYFVPVNLSETEEFTTSKDTLTVLGDIGDVPEDLVDLERWVVIREFTESGKQLKIMREDPYTEEDLVLVSEWLDKAKQVCTRQMFTALPFHPANSIQGQHQEKCSDHFFNPMLDWESIDTDSLSDEERYWETMSQDFPSDPEWVDDTWMHGPNLPGDFICDIPAFLMEFIGSNPEIGTTISICNTQIFEPAISSGNKWAREDHIYIRHPSIAPESPIDVERFILKIRNDWEEQMYDNMEEEFNWDNIKFSYYLVREDKYSDGRPIRPNNLFGVHEWIVRVKEVLDQDLVAELPFFCYDHETDQFWSWQTILDIPAPIQEILGKLPPPYSQIGLHLEGISSEPNLGWWWDDLAAGGVVFSATQKGTIIAFNEATGNRDEFIESGKWTVWYRSERSIDGPVGYALGIWSQTPDYDNQWVQQVDKHVDNFPVSRQPNTHVLTWKSDNNSDETGESDSDVSSVEEETDFRRLQCWWLGRLGPSLPSDSCLIPDWMRLALGIKPELGTTISICQTLRLSPRSQNQHNWSEMITPFGPYSTQKRNLVVLGPMGHLPKSQLDYERLTFALSDDFLGYLEEYGISDSEWSWELIKQNGYLWREQSYLEGRSFEFPVVSLEEWLIRAREVYVKQTCADQDPIEQEYLGIIKPVPGCLKNLLGNQPAPGTHVSIRNTQVRNKEVLAAWSKELNHFGHQFTTNNQEAIVLGTESFEESIHDPLEDISFVVLYDLANPRAKPNSHYVLMVEEGMQGRLSREDIAKWIKWVEQIVRG